MKRKLEDDKECQGTDEMDKKSKKIKDSEHKQSEDNEEMEGTFNMNIKKFRQNLKTGNFFEDLKTFLKNAIKTADNIRAFVQSGGNTIEIVEAIKNNEESSVEVVSSLYQMLRLVISHIIDNGQQMQEPMIQALKCMVHRNKRSIERMLSSKTSDKVLMMKILSIAVNLDGEIGRDVLKNIDVFAKSSDNFTVLEDHQKKKPSYESSTRLAFVHFILAFLLSEKDVILRKKIIQKRALFEFFLRDLHSDNFETIKSVITCLTKNVLISTSFSKPEKLKIFTDNAVRSVLKLYEWKNNVVEKESVCTIAHQFLLLLLTSKKHGIVFKALSEKRQNLRQLQVINTFKTVWNAEYPAMLVIEIIKSCPDLMQIVLNRLVLGLQPKITTDWFMCINFTRELIKALEPSLMFKYFYMLEPKKVSANIIKFSISQFILQNLNERSLIQQENLEIREKATEVIRLQLEQCCKYLNEIRNCEALQDFEKHRIKFDIINHILTFFPNIDVILNSLYRSINLSVSMKASQENENLVKSQLKHTLEILLLLIHNFPSVIEKIPSVIDYLEVLRPIYQYQLSSSSDIDENEDLLIELKVVKIILFLQPSILSLDSEMFNRIFLVLIQVYSCSEINELKNESKFLLTGILQNTQIFPSADSLEISLWLEAFKSVKRGILKESAIVFVLALRSIKTCGFKATNLSSKIIEKCGLNLLKKIDASNESEQSNICAAELSSVLPALISMSSNKINRVIDFLEVSIILLYHSHPQLKSSFVDLLKSDQIELNTKIVNYIQRKSLCDFGEVLEVCEDLIYRQFQRAIIDRKKIEIHVNDVQQLEFLIIQAMFCAVQLEESEQLDLKNVTLLNEYIREFYLKILETEHNDSIIFNDASRISVETDEPKKVNKICELKTVRPSEVVIRYIFEHQKIFLEKFSLSNAGQITSFIIGLSDTFRANELFDTVTKTFKTKIVAEINQSLKQTHHDGILDIVEKFSLDSDSCHSILNAIFKQNITAKKFHINLISFVINQLTQLRSHPLSVKQIQKIEKIYIETVENTAIELFSLESALLEYFKMFNHNIGDLSKIFLTVFREDQAATKSFLLLMNFIFKHSTNWDEDFRNNAAKLKKELLYPLLDVALEKGIIATDKLKPIYQEFKSGIAKAIDKPNKAAQIYRENIHTSVKLIVMVMPINECQDMAMKKFKFEATEIYQLKMMQAIFIKARNTNQEQDGRIFANFINHWLHLFYIYVEKPSATSSTGEYEKILEQWLDMKKVAESPDDHLNTKHWENFYKICLTNGLKAVGDSSMLLVLAKFIRAVNVNLDDVATIFDMILTHSNFFNIVFNYKPSTRKLRRDLFYLLNIVVQKNPSIANEKHIPIFLSSYQASMASYDQLILNLLRFYELRCKIDMYDYRPFLFGPAALHHFTSNEDDDVKLMKKNIDDTTNVFMKLISLFEKTMIENSVNNYPIKRQLAGIAADELDQLLKDSELEMSNVYDPGYFLPLFEMIFSASSFDFTSFAIKNNLMSLIFPALSCEDENMRLLAARILMKCRESTESKKSTKEMWIRFYDSVQHGFGDITEGTKIDSNISEVERFPRAASISTQLLSEIVNILPNSLHRVYNVVANYLIIRQKFDFTTVPELLVLFHSSEVHQDEHRLFLLNAIFNGIKNDLDFKLLNNTPLLKMIFSCYGCPLSERKIDLLILKIIDRLVEKTGKVDFMIQRYGLMLWIFQAAVNAEAFEYDKIEVILSLIANSFDSIKTEVKCINIDWTKNLLDSLLVILPKLTKSRLTSESFLSFLTTVNNIKLFDYIQVNDRDMILELAQVFLSDELMWHVNYLKDYPSAVDYVEHSKKPVVPNDDKQQNVFLSVRTFLHNFQQNHKLKQQQN